LNPLVPKFSSTAFGAPRKPWGKMPPPNGGKSPPIGFAAFDYGLWGRSVLSDPLSVMKAISKFDVPNAVYIPYDSQ